MLNIRIDLAGRLETRVGPGSDFSNVFSVITTRSPSSQPVFNPDGREIIARDNEISALRKEDISMAYYGCHTDITIPYEELGSISVIDEDGESLPIIENGRFVLPGTEELNKPFEV